jgi:hypothetical protein
MNIKRIWLLLFVFTVFASCFDGTHPPAPPIPLVVQAYSLDGTHPPAPPIPL